MRTDLPTGTVTFLFTDVEGSTRLLHELGAKEYAEALAEHRRVIREACAAEHGVEVDTQGDAFFFAFATAPAALAAAGTFNAALAPGRVRVRTGIHTGTPLLTDEGYVGHDVHRAARIAAAAHGGQVVVSASTAALLDRDFELTDLGDHRFKDLAARERVFQLGGERFAALKSLFRTNLPIPANPLVGRNKEVFDVRRLLANGARLVTVTGPGGVGKTRFALTAASEASDRFPDGVWFVDLSPIRDPALVSPMIAHAVEADGDLVHHLRDATSLLVIDNFEQVVAAARDLALLLGACPNVRVLATSREPLRISHEHEYSLDPLPEAPAVELFRHRVAGVAPDVDIEYALAAEICLQLDHLPLAIELAAARSKVFEPEELLARLERRLPVLVSRARDVTERQRALHATIAWSYELLEEDEARVFRALAVFRGGATLSVIEVVTGADPDLVESIVEKSLLRRRRGRLVMLETIREFALDELERSGEASSIRDAHAAYFLELAESANLNAGKLRPGGQRLDIAIAEQDNFRAALDWAIDGRDLELGLRLLAALEQFWVVNDPGEGIKRHAAVLDLGGDVDPALRAEAVRSYASSADIAGQHELALELYGSSLAIFDELGDAHGRAVLLHRLGIAAMLGGDVTRARALVEESHALHERDADTWGIAQTIGTLGAIARDEGDLESASTLVAESGRLAAEVGVPWWQAGMLLELAALSLEADSIADAEENARAGLDLARQLHDYSGRVFGVGVLAGVAGSRGDAERAGRLWGAIEDDQARAPLGGWLRHRASCEARLAASSGAALDAAVAAGRHLSLDDAVALALADA
ncbi:MAG: adenylate/guanylate cyclase domain-containing protein [Actinobacteria bacterium]|nr:adenylate/guanylate cyclase domain-containing protein [Actinomycetota bacterium]